MRDQKTKAQIKKKLWDNTHTMLWTNHPHLSHPPIIHNNNTMDTEFLVQMRQSNKCGSVRDYEIFNLRLGSWCGPLSQHPLSPARHEPHLLIPSVQKINHKKAKNPEMRFNSQQIILYCLGLRTQKPGLREVDLEPSPKRGSAKITSWNKAEKLQKKTSHIVQPGLTNGSQHLER